MLRPVDLFTTASSGINASTRLLQSTGNNIANVNTEGYVRERTEFVGGVFGDVGRARTERLINTFAQNQLRRDITQVGELSTFVTSAERINDILASEANGLSGGLSRFFGAIQTAADDPTNLASREQVIAQGESLLRQMATLSDFMLNVEKQLNLQFSSEVTRANGLIQNIGELNVAIQTARAGGAGDEPTTLLNQRDLAVNELAEILSLSIRENGNGAMMVNLSSGESLVLEDGSFNLMELTSGPDLSTQSLRLQTQFTDGRGNAALNVEESGLGGTMGGLFRFRDEILSVVQRDVGQIALAFADAVNSQNKLGMDLDMQLGGDLFTLPEFTGMNFPDTTTTATVLARVEAGEGAALTDADYKVTVASLSAGVPATVNVELLNANGTAKLDASGNPVIFSGISLGTGFSSIPGGLEVSFGAGSYSVGDSFLFQPTKRAASDVAVATTRAEDIAFASPIRVRSSLSNSDGISLSSVSVSNTSVDASLGVSASAFTGSGTLHNAASAPGGSVGAPAAILFTADDTYQVLDGAGTVISTVTGFSSLENLLAQAQSTGASPAWPAAFSALDDYPGYDLSLSGIPRAGDRFSIEFNTDGIRDNANALAMSELQRAGNVQLSVSGNQPRSFGDAYASMVGRVGERTASADISLQAAEAMQQQSEAWFESQSGVNLDEEAANLIRFQQSYAAAARILSTAQELFNTLLAAVR